MNQRALEELITVYSERLLRYATSILCNYQDAEDIVQDVFMTAYEKWSTFDGENVSAWLYKITYHKSLDRLRKRKILLFAETPDIQVMMPDQLEFSEETLAALRKLKPQERALIHGRIIEGYDYEELAQQIGATPSSLRKRYERAKKKLAKLLTEGQEGAYHEQV